MLSSASMVDPQARRLERASREKRSGGPPAATQSPGNPGGNRRRFRPTATIHMPLLPQNAQHPQSAKVVLEWQGQSILFHCPIQAGLRCAGGPQNAMLQSSALPVEWSYEISHGVWLVKHCLWRHGDVPVGYGSEA